MRIVAWNIRAGGGARTASIARQLGRWTPDVVALCEFRGTPPSLALARSLADLGLGHQITTSAASASAANANCLLVASRWPLTRVGERRAPNEPGRFVLAGVDAPRPF